MLALALLVLAAEPAKPEIAGRVLITSECASGGFDYFFFDKGLVISRCVGCETRPHVQRGTWAVVGDHVEVRLDTEWFGKGTGRVVAAASVNLYERYVAVRGATQEREQFSRSTFAGAAAGCERVEAHDRKADPHSFLRTFEGATPETATRKLTAAEVKRMSTTELRIARNEVYARYGLAFKSKDLTELFAKTPGYEAHLADVEAFLSDVEKANVALLKTEEVSRPAP